MHSCNKWNDTFLDTIREQGDPIADAVVEAIFAQGQVGTVNRLIGQLFRNDASLPETLPGPARAFFAETTTLPEWADPSQIARGVALFGRHAPWVMLILAHYALPLCYAARKGVQAIEATGRLSHSTRPRLVETAQFVFDVMAPGGLEPDGMGIRSIQKVRLIHAAVRHLLLQRGWDPALGLPINQEDMLGTLLSFSVATIDGLRKLGFTVGVEDAEACLHAWNVVAALMGIRQELLPTSFADAEALAHAIRRRQFAPSPEGRRLAGALIDMLQESTRSTPFANLPISLIRAFLGDETAEMLGLPAADWTRHIVGLMRLLGWLTGEALTHLPLLTQIAERFGCSALDGLMRIQRGGGQVEFRIPTALRQLSAR